MRNRDFDGELIVRSGEWGQVYKKDQVGASLIFEGWANYRLGDGYVPETTDPVWKIKRTLIDGDITTITWANFGIYDQIWDNRGALFGGLAFILLEDGFFLLQENGDKLKLELSS